MIKGPMASYLKWLHFNSHNKPLKMVNSKDQGVSQLDSCQVAASSNKKFRSAAELGVS